MFDATFEALTGYSPMQWQRRLYGEFMDGCIPAALDLPTGLGKTSVMAVWLIAREHGAKLPRRLVYVVDRRAVVDQATTEAEKLRGNAKAALGLDNLPISTLRGRFVDNRDWLADPAAPAIIVGTVDMIGSRLLFSGYGVSSRMRPYQAGLLGVDALIVLDEAHLVPPFAHLLRAIEQDASLWPRDKADNALLPRTAVLPLSATRREEPEEESGRRPFRLQEADWRTDCVARKRHWAKKRLSLAPLAPKEQNRQLAEAAWALATMDGRCARVVVFCSRRENGDEGGGPSAQGVKDEIEKLAKGDKRAGRTKVDIHPPELLVGARRVHERDGVAARLRELHFIGDKEPLAKPAFLIATSAGEVGVDIDADHMVSDLTAWERMVQRLGRVNRRGDADAEIRVFWSAPTVKNAAAPTDAEQRALTALAAKAVIEKLPEHDGAFDASPMALRVQAERARGDDGLKALIERATTPEPLRPALTRALVDAWSMTSLDEHTGRPDVAPWLRGWVEDDRPQTTVVWRTYLPVRLEGDEAPDREVENFFEAAPPHPSEMLETETWRAVDWLVARAAAALKPEAPKEEQDGEPEQEIAEEGGAEPIESRRPQPLRANDIVAFALSAAGKPQKEPYRLVSLAAAEKDKKRRDKLKDELAGMSLIVDARLCGLSRDGMLAVASSEPPLTGDGDHVRWGETLAAEREAASGYAPEPPSLRFRVRDVRRREDITSPDRDWHKPFLFHTEISEDGEPRRWLVVEKWRDSSTTEDERSVSTLQELGEHQAWAAAKATALAANLKLAEDWAKALIMAARLHDEGKKAECWQHAFNAPWEKDDRGNRKFFAKTPGPMRRGVLGGYRHEFGSLRYVEGDDEFKRLPKEWQKLVLHLVAAHHGYARPVIGTSGCGDEDGPPSVLADRAREVALRFARLQKRWGPWGLAWLEALLRAADAQASRANDERQPGAAEGA